MVFPSENYGHFQNRHFELRNDMPSWNYILWMIVVLKRNVLLTLAFDNLRKGHLQNRRKVCYQWIVYIFFIFLLFNSVIQC